MIDDFSPKLQSYIKEIEVKTNMEVVIQTVTDLGFPGMEAAFIPDSKDILVKVKKGLDKVTLEQSIAHEVTHGILTYGYNYPTPEVKPPVTPTQKETIQLLITMIEDIVVNHIIYENDFSPFSPAYIDQVINEIKAAENNKDYYSDFQDVDFKNKFKIFRYIMAWGFLQYFSLSQNETAILSKFVKKFQYYFPGQYRVAKEIERTILMNDIFTVEGYKKIIVECLRLWNVDDLVNF